MDIFINISLAKLNNQVLAQVCVCAPLSPTVKPRNLSFVFSVMFMDQCQC